VKKDGGVCYGNDSRRGYGVLNEKRFTCKKTGSKKEKGEETKVGTKLRGFY